MAERELYLFEDAESIFAGISPARYIWMLKYQRMFRDARGYGRSANTKKELKLAALTWLQSDECFYLATLLFGYQEAIIIKNWAADGCPHAKIARKRKADYERESV